MKKRTIFIGLFLLSLLTIFSIPIYAVDGDIRVYSQNSISGLDTLTEEKLQAPGDAEVQFVNPSITSPTVFHMTSSENGIMITAVSQSAVGVSRYSSTGTTGNATREWRFVPKSGASNLYSIQSVAYPGFCLTVNESTGNLILSLYQDFSSQYWFYNPSIGSIQYDNSNSNWWGAEIQCSDTHCYVSETYLNSIRLIESATFTPITSISHSNIYVAMEQTYDVKATLNATPVPPENYINDWFLWSYAESLGIIELHNGIITPVSPGSCTLGFTDKITGKRGTCTVTVTELPNGVYFLKNRSSGNYMQVDVLQNGRPLMHLSLNRTAYTRWSIEADGTGYYRIRSYDTNSPYEYVGLSNGSTAQGQMVNLFSSFFSGFTGEGYRWKIEKNENGYYVFTPKSGEAINLCLTIGTLYNTPDYLIQSTYIAQLSEWELIRMSPLSGAELDYDANWNTTSYNISAYGYAINNQLKTVGGSEVFVEQKPGQFYYNMTYGSTANTPLTTHQNVYSLLNSDFTTFRTASGDSTIKFFPCDQYDTPPDGFYKIAFAYSNDDYYSMTHFLRQDSDGFWSHMYQYNVSQFDYGQEYIINPSNMSFGYPISDYQIKYYIVKPWNNLLSSSSTSGQPNAPLTDEATDEILDPPSQTTATETDTENAIIDAPMTDVIIDESLTENIAETTEALPEPPAA